MSETLELKARRIGDDVAAIWHKVQEKGGMVPHNLNTENLVDILNQVYKVEKWNAKGAFFYTPNGFYDFYTTHEINRMTELPAAPDGYTWRLSLNEVKSILENNNYAIIASDGEYPFDSRFHMVMDDANYLTVELLLTIDIVPDNVRIIWGDGQITQPTAEGTVLYTHTYASTGTYELSLEIEGHTTVTINSHRSGQNIIYTNVGVNMFGDTGAISSSSKMGRYVFGYMTSAILGPKTKFYGPAFYPGVSSYNWSYIIPSNLENVFYTYDVEMLEPICGSPMTTYAMPNSATGFQVYPYGYASGCNGSSLTSFTPSPGFKVIPEFCFRDTQLASFDFSNIETIAPGAFYNVPLEGVVDMSNVTAFSSSPYASEGILTSNNTTTKIILNHEVDIPEDNLISNRYGSSTKCSFYDLTNLEEINIPTNWIIIPRYFIYRSKVDISTLTFPHSLEYIGTGALTVNEYASLASVISSLPSSVKGIAGLGVWQRNINYPVDNMLNVTFPADLEEIGETAFIHRTIENLTLPADITIKSNAFQETWIRGTFDIDASWTCENNAFRVSNIEKPVIHGTNVLKANMFNLGRYDEITFDPSFTGTNLNGAFIGITGEYLETGSAAHGAKITVPATITTLNSREFGGGFSHVTFAGQVPNIPDNAFQATNTFGMVVDMTNCVSVPSTTRAGFGTQGQASYTEVIVPDALYASWVADSDWDYIITNYHLNVIKESEA